MLGIKVATIYLWFCFFFILTLCFPLALHTFKTWFVFHLVLGLNYGVGEG